MNTIWKFRDNGAITECTSFPYAYRYMHNAIRKSIEKGKSVDTASKGMYIISPIKNSIGENVIYSYNKATQMANEMGLINNDGQLNGKEFKNK